MVLIFILIYFEWHDIENQQYIQVCCFSDTSILIGCFIACYCQTLSVWYEWTELLIRLLCFFSREFQNYFTISTHNMRSIPTVAFHHLRWKTDQPSSKSRLFIAVDWVVERLIYDTFTPPPPPLPPTLGGRDTPIYWPYMYACMCRGFFRVSFNFALVCIVFPGMILR